MDASNVEQTNKKIPEKQDLPPFCRLCGKELTNKENVNKEILVKANKLDQIATILSSKGHNNVALIGLAGTGKTALVSALASQIADGKYKALEGRRIVEINVDILLSGVYSVAEKGTRLSNLLLEAEGDGIILFFDEGHRLYGDGESNSLGNIMKPFLTRDKLQVIIATTVDEYNLFIARDPAFKRRFEAVIHKEPDAEETLNILSYVMSKRYPDIRADTEALRTLVDLGRRYILDRSNPDKSLALLDTAVAWAKNHGDDGGNGIVLTKELVGDVVSNRLAVPCSSLAAGIAEGLEGMYAFLSERFPGWNAVCRKITESLNRARIRALRKNGPLAAVVLCGPDARLMLELSLSAAKKLGCAGDGAIFIVDVNKSDPADPYTVCVRRNPNAALIFTGIGERTDPAVISRLREILCNGKLKSASGQSADYSRAYVFLLVEDEPRHGCQIGFVSGGRYGNRLSESACFIVEALGADRNSVVSTGAPDAAYIPKLYENTFTPLLERSAKRCGFEGRIVPSESAKVRVREILSAQTAWSGMYGAVEEIILSVLSERSGGETEQTVIAYYGGRFHITGKSHQLNVEPME